MRIVVKRRLLNPPVMLILSLVASACSTDSQSIDGDSALAIELRWIRSYPTEQRSQVETGLLWALSFLGATLPRDELSPLSWHDDIVTLRVDRAGIDTTVLPHWRRLLSELKASSEYQNAGAIDIGRFVALTLCSSHHYYLLTGASARYEQVRNGHDFDWRLAAIVESSVAAGNRLIEISRGPAAEDIAFVAHEGSGSVQLASFEVTEHEVLEVMPNGQLRFALYDTSGAIKPAADEMITAAGKPSKCLWCHEIRLSRPFAGRTSVRGYYSPSEFEQQIADKAELLRDARAQLRSRIDFDRDQDHTFVELLYLGFYEPSVDRLAHEWGVPIERVEEMLTDFPTHTNTEFEFLGDKLYRRSQVDPLSPYGVIEVPTDPREPSVYEPDLLQ